MKYARSKDDECFVIYHGAPPGPYIKIVVTPNESYALAESLRKYHEEREARAVMNAAEHGALSV